MGEPLRNVSKIANIERMNWTVSYFNERVQREIAEWPVGIYADYLRLILLVEEHGADLRLPHSRAMGGGLFELRCKGAEGIGRAFYCTVIGREIVILHSFIKKTQETPDRELKTARKRLKEVKHAK
ncbi:MAG: type II toxin-antitoxin system RelE/ParE family toxin [Pusillimonas sp.]